MPDPFDPLTWLSLLELTKSQELMPDPFDGFERALELFHVVSVLKALKCQ